jgi:hypothetical protein
MLCRHCRTFAHETDDGGPKYVKVRCARGYWRTPTGRDRVHHVCRVRELVVPGCPEFDTMVADDQDPADCIRAMLATLPETRVVCGGGW